MKVVLTENDINNSSLPAYFSRNHVKGNKEFVSFAARHDLFSFAMEARDLLKRNCSAAVCCPVFRVDIFETQTGA
jgi:hypothetical protein